MPRTRALLFFVVFAAAGQTETTCRLQEAIPVYPASALELRIQGTVSTKFTLGDDEVPTAFSSRRDSELDEGSPIAGYNVGPLSYEVVSPVKPVTIVIACPSVEGGRLSLWRRSTAWLAKLRF